jgi:hypothetical protein
MGCATSPPRLPKNSRTPSFQVACATLLAQLLDFLNFEAWASV